jgi:hypothetical protein
MAQILITLVSSESRALELRQCWATVDDNTWEIQIGGSRASYWRIPKRVFLCVGVIIAFSSYLGFMTITRNKTLSIWHVVTCIINWYNEHIFIKYIINISIYK